VDGTHVYWADGWVKEVPVGGGPVTILAPGGGSSLAVDGWHVYWGAGGYYVYDVTDLQAPKLITSVTGVSGVQFGHTFTPDPTGRYAEVGADDVVILPAFGVTVGLQDPTRRYRR
jgi:hypothetical protein